MSYTNQSTIEAVNTLIENRISQLKFDKTIQAEIQSVKDYSEGSYYITYQNNKLIAYAQDTSQTYSKGDAVLVQVPENDLSNKKIIIGKSKAEQISEAELSYYQNQYEDIQGTLKEISGTDFEPINISNYDYFKVIVTIHRDKSNTNMNGNLVFYGDGNQKKENGEDKKDAEGNEIKNQYLITPDMFTGNYYMISDETQEFLLERKFNDTTITSITFPGENTTFTYSDIKIQPVSKVNAEALYSLNLVAPNGLTGANLTLRADFKERFNILPVGDCKFYWYRQDLRHNEKNQAGYGWIVIPSNGTNILTLDKLEAETVYKVVAIYGDNKVVLSKEIKLNAGLPEIQESTEGVETSYFYPAADGSYIGPDSVLDTAKPIYYIQKVWEDSNGNLIPIRIEKIVETDSEKPNDIIYNTKGQYIFLYNQNNLISEEDASLNRTFTFELPENYTIIKWEGPNNTVLSKTTPVTIDYAKKTEATSEIIGCMLQNMWVDQDNKTLHFTLKKDLKRNEYYHNFINITLSNGAVIRKDFFFIAEGDIGTNGTGFAVLVEGVDSEGNIIEYPETAENLKAFVIKNDQIINDNRNYEITYKWNNSNLTAQIVGISNFKDEEDNPLNYIPLEVEINEGKGIKLFYTYVKVPRVPEGNNKKRREELTSYIKYNREGKNSEYIIGPNQWENTYNTFTSEKVTYTINNIAYNTFCYLDLHDSVDMDAWDGTSVKINDNSSIFSPTIGAGKKETDDNNSNVFTGFLMGKYNNNSNSVGIYGFNKGNLTFKVDETGNAYFKGEIEASGGTIGGWTISADSLSGKGSISGGTISGSSISGGTISSSKISGGTIKIGSNFSVTNLGVLKASEANIQGDITTDSIYSSSLKIKGEDNFGKSIFSILRTDSEVLGVSYVYDEEFKQTTVNLEGTDNLSLQGKNVYIKSTEIDGWGYDAGVIELRSNDSIQFYGTTVNFLTDMIDFGGAIISGFNLDVTARFG